MKQLAFISQGKVVSVSEYSDDAVPSNHLVDVTALDPQPSEGWTYDGTTFTGIRRIHKSFFINRLSPWWADIQAARAADPVIDNYFEQFGYRLRQKNHPIYRTRGAKIIRNLQLWDYKI